MMMVDMQVATASMPLYATLPALTEAVVERGWTRVYSRIGDVGVGWYLGYFVLYMASVEFFVYWMHRGLHDVRTGYRCLKLSSNHSSWRFSGGCFCCCLTRHGNCAVLVHPGLLPLGITAMQMLQDVWSSGPGQLPMTVHVLCLRS